MTPTKPITVLLADDHELVRKGLRAVLEMDGHIRVVGEARNGREAVQKARKQRPDVILMDISMPIMNGLEATSEILAERPSAKIVILSAHLDEEYMSRARATGAVGYIAKQMPADAMAQAVHEVALGRNLYGPVDSPGSSRAERKGRAPEGAPAICGRLTARDSELLRLVAEGSPTRQIAASLCLSVSAVESLLAGLMAKLSVSCMANLTHYAIACAPIENDVDLVIT